MIKRVLQIEHENFLKSPKLSLEWIDWDNRAKGLYAELGIDPNNSKYWRTKVKPRIMKIIRGTLDSLIEKGIIIGYTEYRDDGTNNRAKAIKGFLIELPPSEKKGHARRKPGTQKP